MEYNKQHNGNRQQQQTADNPSGEPLKNSDEIKQPAEKNSKRAPDASEKEQQLKEAQTERD